MQHLIEDMKHTNIKTNRKKNDFHVRALIKMAISIDPIRVILTEQPREKNGSARIAIIIIYEL